MYPQTEKLNKMWFVKTLTKVRSITNFKFQIVKYWLSESNLEKDASQENIDTSVFGYGRCGAVSTGVALCVGRIS